ncbi:MAG: hypothetical protein ACYTFA_15465, partial [Planctomycetota bacterium]
MCISSQASAYFLGDGLVLIKIVHLLGSVACAVSILVTSQFAAGQDYTIRDLGTLGGNYSDATGINAVGQVVGTSRTSDGAYRAFIWENGQRSELTPLPGYSGCEARDVNDAGLVVGGLGGWFYSRALMWERIDQAWQMSEIESADWPFLLGFAEAVNQKGQVVGSSTTDYCSVTEIRAWRWENGSATFLDCLAGPFTCEAHDINQLGQVVGASTREHGACVWRSASAVVWSPDGQITELGTLPGGDHAVALGINDLGEVVGFSNAESAWRAPCLWLPAPKYGLAAGMHQLGTLGGGYGFAYAINNIGQVVGSAGTATHTEHAFLWQDGTITDLNDLLPPDSGWELT